MRKRNRPRRCAQLALAGALLVAMIAAVPDTARAAGAGYYAVQCHDRDLDASEMAVSAHGRYPHQDKCEGAERRIQIENSAATLINQGTQYTLTAPAGTVIREAHVDANLRRGSHHLAQVGVWNGAGVEVLANGPDSNPQWRHYDFGGLDHRQLVIRLFCSDGGGCAQDDTAHAYVRNIAVLLADNAEPAAPGVGGGLLAGGWLRGTQSLTASASDSGAGISAVRGWVNGVQVASAGSCETEGVAWPWSGRLVPCAASASLSRALDTAAGPFRNGQNAVGVRASDYPGNQSSVVERTVLVDNLRPTLAFANTQDPEDPELIRAPVFDEHSGVAGAKLYLRRVGASDWQPLETRIEGGEALARVDSAALPAGEYEFRATASDVAGNPTETTVRQNGTPMQLTFPLRGAVELQAHLGQGGGKGQTVPYGTESSVEGRLLDASGDPIAGERVVVTENFGEGALIRHRPTTVTTTSEGRFESKVPAGPTRRVTAMFAGSQRYLAASTDVGELTVRSRASFQVVRKAVREGERATFRGKVGHVGARIPSGGKLIELQVRLRTGRWDTVGEAFRTDARGRYVRRYRFGRHYVQDALFRFRVKVQKEGDWPYRRAASRQRKVVVRAR